MSDIVAVAFTLAQTLEKLGVVYWIGGSMASAVHGVPRSTQDVNFVAELKEEHVDDLVAALENDFYIDREVVRLKAFDDAGIDPTAPEARKLDKKESFDT